MRKNEFILKKRVSYTFFIATKGVQEPKGATQLSCETVESEQKNFFMLEAAELVKIERREGKIYAAIETELGQKVLGDIQYSNWIAEFD